METREQRLQRSLLECMRAMRAVCRQQAAVDAMAPGVARELFESMRTARALVGEDSDWTCDCETAPGCISDKHRREGCP